MIGLVVCMGLSTSNSSFAMDRKRRRLDPSEEGEGMTTLGRKKLLLMNSCSSPPRWHTSLKHYLSNVIEEEYMTTASLCDVTQLLVDSGYVNSVDAYHMSQTCTVLHRLTNRQSVWKAFCEQEFPGGTKQIPKSIVTEKGYKWLYREWKSTMHSRQSSNKPVLPLKPPRLTSDQLVFYVHINQDNRPLHSIPIVLTGSDVLSPLLNHGKLMYQFPKPVNVTISSGVPSSVATLATTSGNDTSSQGNSGENLQVRMHLLSFPDATMCCVYNETMPLRDIVVSNHHRRLHNGASSSSVVDGPDQVIYTTEAAVSKMEPVTNMTTKVLSKHDDEDTCVDFGPTDVTTFQNCELRLRHSSATAAVINHRLLSNTIVLRVGLCCSCDIPNEGTTTTGQNDGCLAITRIRIEALKYDRRNNDSCHVYDSDAEVKDGGSGVTVLHYLSDIQFS